MDNFVAIDVETANREPTSICSIGAVKVIDGTIVDSLYELVKPEPEYYLSHFTYNIHGIGLDDTASCKTFDRIWPQFADFIGKLPLVAHNKAFDERCIKACFRTYGMDYPDYRFFCTLEAAKRIIPRQLCGGYSLPVLCNFMGIPFDNHHHALDDSIACAKLAMTLL